MVKNPLNLESSKTGEETLLQGSGSSVDSSSTDVSIPTRSDSGNTYDFSQYLNDGRAYRDQDGNIYFNDAQSCTWAYFQSLKQNGGSYNPNDLANFLNQYYKPQSRDDANNADSPLGNNPSGINPDGTLNFDEILSNLQNILSLIFQGDLSNSGKNIVDVLADLQKYIQQNMNGMSKDEASQLSTQVYNILNSYLTAQLEQMYNRQNWLLENDYNSPRNQMALCMEAGLNPVYYFTGSGSSSASAGRIGDASIDSGSMNFQPQSALSDGLQNVLGVTQAASNIGNVASYVSQANLAYQQAMTERQMRPDKLAAQKYTNAMTLAQTNLFNEQAKNIKELTPTQVDVNKTQAGYNRANTRVASSQQYLNYWNAWGVYQNARLGQESIAAQYVGQYLNYNASLYSANKSYLGTVYAANKAYQGAIENKQYDVLMDLMHNNYTENSKEEFFSVDGSTQTRLSTEESSKVAAMIADGSVSVGADGTFISNGKTYKRVQSTDHRLNFALGQLNFLGMRALTEGIKNGDVSLTPQQLEALNGDFCDFQAHWNRDVDNVLKERMMQYTVSGLGELFGTQVNSSLNNGFSLYKNFGSSRFK